MWQILVIDDDARTHQFITDLLEGEDIDIAYTHDGERGIMFTRDNQPNVVLLDLLLPMMQGWEVASVLKASPITRHIPVIAISGHYDLDLEQRALDAGCNAFIEKPFDAKRLRDHIMTLLEAPH